MKTFKIISAVFAVVVALAMVSCEPSREYSYYHPSRTSVSLIISGGYGWGPSYRSAEGYTYWRGDDNRYYLDRQYVGRVHYDHHEYNEWKHGWRRHHNW